MDGTRNEKLHTKTKILAETKETAVTQIRER